MVTDLSRHCLPITLIRLCGLAGLAGSLLFLYAPKIFSHSTAQLQAINTVYNSYPKYMYIIGIGRGINSFKMCSFLLFFFVFFIWVIRSFQEYFTYIELIVHQMWVKTREPGEKPPDHP